MEIFSAVQIYDFHVFLSHNKHVFTCSWLSEISSSVLDSDFCTLLLIRNFMERYHRFDLVLNKFLLWSKVCNNWNSYTGCIYIPIHSHMFVKMKDSIKVLCIFLIINLPCFIVSHWWLMNCYLFCSTFHWPCYWVDINQFIYRYINVLTLFQRNSATWWGVTII